MHDANQAVSLPNVFALLRRHSLLITLTTVLAVGISLGLSASTDPSYVATSQIGFNDDSDNLRALGVQATPSFQPEKEVAAQAARITRPDTIADVRDRLRLRLPASDIQSMVTTRVEVASNLVSIRAEAPTAKLAADLANAFAQAAKNEATRRTQRRYRSVADDAERQASRLKGKKNEARRAVFQDRAAQLRSIATFARPADIVRSAERPRSPSSPKPVRDAVLAGLLGLMLGLGLAFLRQALDRRLREPADVEEHLDVPVLALLRTTTLGRTPFPSTAKKRRILSEDEDLEAFRILRTNVALVDGAKPVTTLLVTSALPEEGKSTVAVGLAWAEAMTGRKTLLVDCDLRRPTIAERLEVPSAPGLSDFLLGEVEPADILRTVTLDQRRGPDAPQLVCIPAGRFTPEHAELLDSERFREFLAQVAEVYDRVILDSAPLLPVSDTLALLPRVDAVLLCVRLGQTRRDEAIAARAALDRSPTARTGLVLTAADRGQTPYYAGSYAYAGPPAAKAS
jgi:capsular exopolysaccharide synthesis family protein